jgi:hypothetical protein
MNVNNDINVTVLDVRPSDALLEHQLRLSVALEQALGKLPRGERAQLLLTLGNRCTAELSRIAGEYGRKDGGA